MTVILTTNQVVVRNLKVAKNFFQRMKGLLGTKTLENGEGLLIPKCQGVHTFGMRYPIDVVFLDKSLRVLHTIQKMPPQHTSPIKLSAQSVLELPAGTIDRSHLSCGDQLVLKD